MIGGVLVSTIGGTEALFAFTAVFALGTFMTLGSPQLRGLPVARDVAKLRPEA